MKSNRITNHPVLGDIEPRNVISFTFDGKTYSGYEGDTIASALLANGIRQLRVNEQTMHPTAIYCNIGPSFECRATADGEKAIRACMTPIRPDMIVERGQMDSDPLKSDDAATD